MAEAKLKIVCPCCETKIIVDAATGAVLSHEPPEKGPAKTFEQAVSEAEKRRREAEDRFAQAVREHRHRDQILEKKFREALERAEKDDAPPPPHPFEFD